MKIFSSAGPVLGHQMLLFQANRSKWTRCFKKSLISSHIICSPGNSNGDTMPNCAYPFEPKEACDAAQCGANSGEQGRALNTFSVRWLGEAAHHLHLGPHSASPVNGGSTKLSMVSLELEMSTRFAPTPPILELFQDRYAFPPKVRKGHDRQGHLPNVG